MEINKFSDKQREILNFVISDGNTLICDGAVRSGKTVVMTFAFILWAMEYFDKTNFGICGKTVQSAERNILRPFQTIDGLPYDINYKQSNHCMTVRCGSKTNNFYLFGGKDERSYTLIQGITLAGVLFDEVALMPESFVNQAIARTLSYRNAKLWFNCNPGSPSHWFNKNWIADNPHNAVRLQFLMNDNPILGKEEIERAEKMYSGVFYERYILGRWVNAEGLIYRMFADNPSRYDIDRSELPQLRYINIGVDFGGNKSQHAFVATGFTAKCDTAYVLRSESLPANGTTVDQIVVEFERFASAIEHDFGFVDFVYADCAEKAIINTMRQRTKYNIRDSIKNSIIDRIRCENLLLSSERLKLVRGYNTALADGLKEARWDDDKNEDVRLDNGTSNIDILDAFEYSFEKYIRQLLGG